MTLKFRRRFHSIPLHRRRFAGYCRSARVCDPFNYVAYSTLFPPSGVYLLLADAAATETKLNMVAYYYANKRSTLVYK